MLMLRTAKVGILPNNNSSGNNAAKPEEDENKPKAEERLAPHSAARVSVAVTNTDNSSDENNHSDNNDMDHNAEDVETIQPWHVVLGDTSSRSHRTTVATKLLREVKREYRKKWRGKKWSLWVPLAIQEFYQRLRADTDIHCPNEDDLGLILLKCSDKTKDRMQNGIIIPCYKYAGDEKPLYGIAKPQEALKFFFVSRDSPTLANELMRHQKQLDLLQKQQGINHDNLPPPPKAMMDTFAATLLFYQEHLKKAEQGEELATMLLNSSPSPINTLKALWEKLVEKRAEMKRESSDASASESDAETTEQIQDEKIDCDTKTAKPEHPRAYPSASTETEAVDPIALLLHSLEQEGIDLAQSEAFIIEAMKDSANEMVEHDPLLSDGLQEEDLNPLPFELDELEWDDLKGLDSFNLDSEVLEYSNPTKSLPYVAAPGPNVDDVDGEISSSERFHPRDESDNDRQEVGASPRVKRVRLLGGVFFPLVVVATIAGVCFVPESHQQDPEHYSPPTFNFGYQPFNESVFNLIVDKLENDVVEFGQHLEDLYSNRCEEEQLQKGQQGNYDACQSAYPNAECLGGESFHVTACSKGDELCPGMYDFTVSTVRLPAQLMSDDINITNSRALEAIRYTQAMEEWLQNKRAADEPFWDDLKIQPRAWHFGSTSGAFRIYPARPSEECGVYDPRSRPWYVSASSGPKNVILVLDTSRSMAGFRLELLKQAAARIVSTLTANDRISIVPFGSSATHPMTDKRGNMMVASEDNKKTLLHKIEKLKAGGETNFYDAFEKAFDILDQSAAQGDHAVHCNTAILFLTDGEMKEKDHDTADAEKVEEERSEEAILDLVSERLETSGRLLSNPILLFTFSISDKERFEDLPSKLACSTEWGIWSQISSDANIIDTLSSYYRIFALGLGSGPNKDFVTWVLPYEYDPGETLGTSVSVPVFDRSKDPPLFLGVATIDVSMAALDSAVGSGPEQNSEGVLRRLASKSAAQCPVLKLGRCQMESFRQHSAPDGDFRCSSHCTMEELMKFEEEMCLSVEEDGHSENIWANTDNAGLSFDERGACFGVEDDYEDGADFPLVVVGIVLVGTFALLNLAVIAIWRNQSRSKNKEQKPAAQPFQADEEEGNAGRDALSSMSADNLTDD